jgi:hypothetical protein
VPAPKDLIVSLPTQVASAVSRRALTASLKIASLGIDQAGSIIARFGGGAAPAPRRPAADVYPREADVQVAVDEHGAVGSFTDNTGVEPDGAKPPFPGYDKLGGDRLIAHVAESTDLPDLQVLLAYEEAHKNRKGVIEAVETRLAALGAPVS